MTSSFKAEAEAKAEAARLSLVEPRFLGSDLGDDDVIGDVDDDVAPPRRRADCSRWVMKRAEAGWVGGCGCQWHRILDYVDKVVWVCVCVFVRVSVCVCVCFVDVV